MGKADLYEYTVDFDKIMKVFEGAAKDMLVANPIRNRTVTYRFDIQGGGDLLTKDNKPRDKAGKLSPAQRMALGKMHEPFVKKWLTKAEAETRAVCDKFLKEYSFTFGKKSVWLHGTTDSTKKKATEALTNEVAEIRAHYVDKIHNKIAADLKSYRAGRARKAKIIGQGAKHAVKPVLRVAGSPLALLTTPPPLVPVAAVLALKNMVTDTKDTIDFFSAKYRSMDRLEKSINKHLATFMERATEAKGKATKVRNKLPRNEPKAFDPEDVIVRELTAIAMMDIYHVHKRSVANLEHIMGKYQKCMDKSRYLILRAVKKIEKAEDHLTSLNASKKEFTTYSAKLDGKISQVRTQMRSNATPELNRLLASLLKDLAGNKDVLKTVKSNIKTLETQVSAMKKKANKLFDKFMERELAFHQYKKDLKRLNRAMPKKLGVYKTVLEMALAVLHLAEFGMSVTGDTMDSANLLQATSIDPSAVADLSNILTKFAMTAGYSEAAFDQLGDILNGGDDFQALAGMA